MKLDDAPAWSNNLVCLAMPVALILLLMVSCGRSLAAVDCETVKAYSAGFTKKQLADMAKANGISEKEQKEYAICFEKPRKRKMK